MESGSSFSSKISYTQLMLDQGVLTQEIIDFPYEGSGTEEDPYVVEWIDNDPRNPITWRSTRKWIYTGAMALATLVVAFCSSAYSGGMPQVMVELKASQTLTTAGMSLFVLGFALGPLIWAPMSELYGRQVVFCGTFAAFTAFNAGAGGSQNIQTLLILRFFAGAFGSSPLTNAGGVVADMFTAKERGVAMAIFSMAPFMGPVIGPIVSGFLGMTEGWRWVEGLMAIFSGVVGILCVFLVPESYAPVLLRKRAAALSRHTGKVYLTRGEIEQGKLTVTEAFSTNLKRPWLLLFCEPIVLILSLYMAIVYGILYLLFGAFPIVYRGRGWNEGVAGLPFIGVAIGMFFALVFVLTYDNVRYQRCIKNSPNGVATPEDRLPSAMVGGLVLPIGLFWFSWTNSPSLPWPASVAAAIPFGFGMLLVFLSLFSYLVDAYTVFAASVLAGSGVLRSLFGAAFPLFTFQMYRNLGIHWASMIPAFLSVACAVFPFILYKYGATIRKKCKYAAEAEAFMERMRARAAALAAATAAEPESETSSGTAAVNDQDADNTEPSFEEMKTAQEAQGGLERTTTGRSHRSQRKTATLEYEPNPYDIDRVNTRESFGPGGIRRSDSRASGA
ncbi:MFS multidrug transporter-like protein [Westerdykella ornata]|uniref:MFS multidrug transporter-like protein n=1 Tax=Westerdykella ornata TaxID=318751 RepID=A0A6A6JKN7_WESOR|nr:MFS multidrug transporter-like protein [Westerdykella ornata]KAF2276256.1 MFS multidrug transporter-like protein [Westerdykella ornata]